MAVPKKKTSRSRRDSRKATWKKKVQKQVKIALSLAKSLTNKDSSSNFIIA